MKFLIRIFFVLGLVFGAEMAAAACVDGTTTACTVNGCKGVSECVGGRFTPCQVLTQCTAGSDTIAVSNAVPYEPIGIFYDGRTASASFNDRRANATADSRGAATLTLDTMIGGAYGNLHTVFSRGRSPTSVLRTWTASADTLPVALDPEVGFGVTFWILPNDFANLSRRAASAVIDMNVIYDTERTGLRITRYTVKDASTNPFAAGLLNATASEYSQYVNNIGSTPGDLNVYVTNTVNGTTNSAFTWDGLPQTCIAANVLIGTLLTHEFGHSFALGHVGPPAFDITNMMNPVVGGTTRYFADGQIFEMHRHPSSQVNALFRAHVGRPSYACPGTTDAVTNECPSINRRLWADGTYPAN